MAQDSIDMSEKGDYIIITNVNEIVNRKLFADNVKAEINRLYGKIKTADSHIDVKSLYPSDFTPMADMMKVIENLPKTEPVYMDTDSIAVIKKNICQNIECNNIVEETQTHCCPICKIKSEVVDFLKTQPKSVKKPVEKPFHNWKRYYLITYVWHLYGYPDKWHYENTVIDHNPIDWLKSKIFNRNPTKLLNATVITKEQYDSFKELDK
jgi:hypothetical protein